MGATSVKAGLKALLAKVVAKIASEPVAFWGVLATALLNGAAAYFGLSAGVVDIVASGLMLFGIPVVRSKVSPVVKK